MLVMDTLAELVDLYLLRCDVEGKSPNTVRAYRETLGRFLRTLAEDDSPIVAEAILSEHIYAYLARSTGLSLETRHRYFREVRCFFNWLVETGHLESNPFRGMRNVRLPQRIVQPFSVDEITALLAACDPETEAGLRDRAIIFTLLDTGVRCSELVQLSIEPAMPWRPRPSCACRVFISATETGLANIAWRASASRFSARSCQS